MLNSNRPCGWAGTISSFLKIEKPKDEWLVSLKKHHKRCMGESAKSSQISAWRDTYKIISNTLEELKKTSLDPPTGPLSLNMSFRESADADPMS